MRTPLITSLLLTFLSGSPVFAQDWAKKMFPTTTHDFGSVAKDSKTEYEFKLKNLYIQDIHIASVRTSCGCTSPRIEKAWLKTHEQGAIIAKINTDKFRGKKGATLTVTIDKPYPATLQLHVKVNIHGDVRLSPSSVQFSSVEQGSAVEKKLEVRLSGRSNMRITGVESANGYLSGKVVGTRRGYGQTTYQLLVRLGPDAPPGYLRDHLMLVTNDRRRTRIPVRVEGYVASALTVSPASLNLGVLRPGEEVRRQLLVRGKKPFRVTVVTSDGGQFKFETSVDGAPKTLHLIPVVFIAGDAPGKVVQRIRIETDLGDATTELLASALVSAP